MDVRRVLQGLSLGMSLASLLVVCYRYKLSHMWTTRHVLVAPIVFLLHITTYYITVLLSQESIDLDHIYFGTDLNFHTWSSGITLHGVITVIFLVYAYTKSKR